MLSFQFTQAISNYFFQEHFFQDFNSQLDLQGCKPAILCDEIEPGTAIVQVSAKRLRVFQEKRSAVCHEQGTLCRKNARKMFTIIAA